MLRKVRLDLQTLPLSLLSLVCSVKVNFQSSASRKNSNSKTWSRPLLAAQGLTEGSSVLGQLLKALVTELLRDEPPRPVFLVGTARCAVTSSTGDLGVQTVGWTTWSALSENPIEGVDLKLILPIVLRQRLVDVEMYL